MLSIKWRRVKSRRRNTDGGKDLSLSLCSLLVSFALTSLSLSNKTKSRLNVISYFTFFWFLFESIFFILCSVWTFYCLLKKKQFQVLIFRNVSCLIFWIFYILSRESVCTLTFIQDQEDTSIYTGYICSIYTVCNSLVIRVNWLDLLKHVCQFYLSFLISLIFSRKFLLN